MEATLLAAAVCRTRLQTSLNPRRPPSTRFRRKHTPVSFFSCTITKYIHKQQQPLDKWSLIRPHKVPPGGSKQRRRRAACQGACRADRSFFAGCCSSGRKQQSGGLLMSRNRSECSRGVRRYYRGRRRTISWHILHTMNEVGGILGSFSAFSPPFRGGPFFCDVGNGGGGRKESHKINRTFRGPCFTVTAFSLNGGGSAQYRPPSQSAGYLHSLFLHKIEQILRSSSPFSPSWCFCFATTAFSPAGLKSLKDCTGSAYLYPFICAHTGPRAPSSPVGGFQVVPNARGRGRARKRSLRRRRRFGVDL